jgi:hypothetical protein
MAGIWLGQMCIWYMKKSQRAMECWDLSCGCLVMDIILHYKVFKAWKQRFIYFVQDYDCIYGRITSFVLVIPLCEKEAILCDPTLMNVFASGRIKFIDETIWKTEDVLLISQKIRYSHAFIR